MNNLPRLWAKYIGHDDNRDFYMSNMKETTNMNRQLFLEWFPQIIYNHHQTGPAGAVIFMPPFRDPFNYNFDPLVPLGIDMVGAAMHSRLVAEGKGGSAMRSGSSYSTWWNGGLRTISYFHNMIGILTEIIGSPTPGNVAVVPGKQLPQGDWPMPVAPGPWHYRQSIDYEITNNYAILDLASRYRETFLFNIWRMGMNSIEKGSKDFWTVTPKRIDALNAAAGITGGGRGRGAAAADVPPGGDTAPAGGGGGGGGGGRGGGVSLDLYNKVLHDPKLRDPRGYILPADQDDFPTAAEFINALLKNGITCLKATSAFQVAGKSYPAGSYVVKTAQAFRPHVMDMFEPQDHPNDFAYPGGPPNRPYDITGWTLAMQMGVKYDRILDGFRRSVREDQRTAAAACEQHHRAGESSRVPDQPRDQQFLHPDEPAAQSRWRSLLAEAGTDGQRQEYRHGSYLGARFRGGACHSRQGSEGTRHSGVRARQSSDRRRYEAQADPHRAVRFLRRQHALGLDALAVRAV